MRIRLQEVPVVFAHLHSLLLFFLFYNALEKNNARARLLTVQVFARLENELAMCNHMLHLMHSVFIFFIPRLCAMCVQLQMIHSHNF